MYKSSSKPQQTSLFWDLETMLDSKHPPLHEGKEARAVSKEGWQEPVIGHCKSDHRLGRNYYKGLFGDFINVMIAAATFNFKRAMRALFCLFQEVLSGWIKPFIRLKNLYVWQVPSCYADMRTRELAF